MHLHLAAVSAVYNHWSVHGSRCAVACMPRGVRVGIGGRHTPVVRTGVFPGVFPAYVSYALYVLELNVRASVVLGLVGAGGIGRVLEAQRQFFKFDRILGILVLIFVVVWVVDHLSMALRKRLV